MASNDKKWAAAFNDSLASGMNNADAKIAAFNKTGINLDEVSDDILVLADNADKAGINIQNIGIKSKIASVGVKALTAAANMFIVMAASWAIGKLFEGIEYLVNYADHMSENLSASRSKVEENETAIEEYNKELENTRKLMNDLEKLGEANWSPVDKEEYELLEKTNKELERKLAVEQALLRINQRKNESNYITAFGARVNSTKVMGGYNPLHAVGSNEEFVSDLSKYGVSSEFAQDLVGSFVRMSEGNSISSYVSAAGEFEANKKNFADNLASIQAYQQEIFEIHNEIQKLQEQDVEGADSSIQAKIKAYDEDIAKFEKKITQYEKANTDLQITMGNYLTSLQNDAEGFTYIEGPNLTHAEKQINDQLKYTEYVADSYANLENVVRAEYNFATVFDADIFAEQTAQLKKLAAAGQLTADVLTTQFSQMYAEWERLGWTADQVVDKIVSDVGGMSVLDTPSLTSYSEVTASSWRATEAYTALTEAIDAQNEAGVLSTEAFQALIEANSEYIELLELTAEGYKFNEEALWKYIEAQDQMEKGEAILALKNLQEAMALTTDEAEKASYQSQIDNLAAYIGELDRATGALAKFRAAQETPDQDEEFGEGEKAFETIKEGLKTGKIGTDNFKSAMGFMLGENWEQEYEGNIQKAYDKAKKIGTRYFGQKDERKGMANFRDDLVKAGVANYDKKSGKFSLGLSEDGDAYTIQEIADALAELPGMAELSEDAILSLFGLMEAYGGEFDFSYNFTQEDRDLIQTLGIEDTAQALTEVEQEQEKVIGKMEELAQAGEAGSDEYSQYQQTLNNLNAAEEELINHSKELATAIGDELAGAGETLTLEEIIAKVAELKNAIDTLNTNGITVPVTMTEQYDDLNNLLTILGADTGFSLTVTDENDAQAKLDAIKATLEAIQANPNINSEVKAQLTGIAKAQMVQLQALLNSDGKISNVTINATDNGTIAEVKTAIEGVVNENYDTVITVKYDLDGDGAPDGKTLDEFTAGIQAGIIESDGNGGYSYSENRNKHVAENVAIEAKADFSDVEKSKEKVEDTPIETTATVDPASTEQMSVDIQEQVESVTYTGEAQIMYDEPAGPPLPPDWTVPVSTDTSTAESQVDSVTSEIETGAIKPVDADVSEALKANASLESSLKRPVTKTIKLKASNVEPYASGTTNAVGGTSLVDEKGAELIEHTSRGTYELGTNNGPRFTELDPGDVVHTASETKKIMSRMAKIGGFFRDGLNKGKSIIGNAFATGVSGSMSWSLINKVLSSGSSSSKKNTSSSKNNTKTSNWKTYVEKLFDWIEIRLDRLQTQTDKWILAASEAIGYMAKNTELDKALASTSQQIDETTQAYQRYIEQAQIIATKTKLSASVIKQIQEGTIDIASYSEANQEKIRAYQEW